jgi:hypothetical protein
MNKLISFNYAVYGTSDTHNFKYIFLVPVASKHAVSESTTMVNIEFVTEFNETKQVHRLKMPVEEFYKFLQQFNHKINSALLMM